MTGLACVPVLWNEQERERDKEKHDDRPQTKKRTCIETEVIRRKKTLDDCQKDV